MTIIDWFHCAISAFLGGLVVHLFSQVFGAHERERELKEENEGMQRTLVQQAEVINDKTCEIVKLKGTLNAELPNRKRETVSHKDAALNRLAEVQAAYKNAGDRRLQ